MIKNVIFGLDLLKNSTFFFIWLMINLDCVVGKDKGNAYKKNLV